MKVRTLFGDDSVALALLNLYPKPILHSIPRAAIVGFMVAYKPAWPIALQYLQSENIQLLMPILLDQRFASYPIFRKQIEKLVDDERKTGLVFPSQNREVGTAAQRILDHSAKYPQKIFNAFEAHLLERDNVKNGQFRQSVA